MYGAATCRWPRYDLGYFQMAFQIGGIHRGVTVKRHEACEDINT